MSADYVGLFGYALIFWIIGYSASYLMLKFKQGLELL